MLSRGSHNPYTQSGHGPIHTVVPSRADVFFAHTSVYSVYVIWDTLVLSSLQFSVRSRAVWTYRFILPLSHNCPSPSKREPRPRGCWRLSLASSTFTCRCSGSRCRWSCKPKITSYLNFSSEGKWNSKSWLICFVWLEMWENGNDQPKWSRDASERVDSSESVEEMSLEFDPSKSAD